MTQLIASASSDVPAALAETYTSKRTLEKRTAAVMAYPVRTGESNGPAASTNGRLTHLRDPALGIRNLHQLATPLPSS